RPLLLQIAAQLGVVHGRNRRFLHVKFGNVLTGEDDDRPNGDFLYVWRVPVDIARQPLHVALGLLCRVAQRLLAEELAEDADAALLPAVSIGADTARLVFADKDNRAGRREQDVRRGQQIVIHPALPGHLAQRLVQYLVGAWLAQVAVRQIEANLR